MEIPIFGRKMIFFAINVVILGLLAAGYIMGTSSYVFKITKIPTSLQQEEYQSRFAQYPGCFAYQDPNTQRTYAYWIDMQKFTNEQFQRCLQFPPSKTDLCYELQLARLVPSRGQYSLTEEQLRSIRSNNYSPACTEGAKKTVTKKATKIIDGEQQYEGILTIAEFTKK
ncbi:hypothetical protein HY488_01710 [Candidatus Woesearchaeota archaeon]|nr:hypothetical protein [Candidatus Woesearchaeota archaeon]